jgi:hypothetical protein
LAIPDFGDLFLGGQCGAECHFGWGHFDPETWGHFDPEFWSVRNIFQGSGLPRNKLFDLLSDYNANRSELTPSKNKFQWQSP